MTLAYIPLDTSSPPTSWSPTAATPRCSTSVSPSSSPTRRGPVKRRRSRQVRHEADRARSSPRPARRWVRSPTCRRSRCSANDWMCARTSSRSAPPCTRWPLGRQGAVGARRQDDLFHLEPRERLLRCVGDWARSGEGHGRRRRISSHALHGPRAQSVVGQRLGAGREPRSSGGASPRAVRQRMGARPDRSLSRLHFFTGISTATTFPPATITTGCISARMRRRTVPAGRIRRRYLIYVAFSGIPSGVV